MPDHPMDEFRKWNGDNDEFYIVSDTSGFDEHPDFDEYTIGDYFQRMALTRTERSVRVEIAKTIKKKVEDFFWFQWEELSKGWFLTLTSSEDYRNLLFDLYMTFSSLADEYMTSLARRWANEVEDYTERVITSSPDYPKFQAIYWNQIVNGNMPKSSRVAQTASQIATQAAQSGGASELEQVSRAETSPDILNVLSSKRAERISLNETNVILNYERHLDLVADKHVTHTWQTMEDEKVRPDHVIADGQTVPIDEPFYVGGEYLMFPGDTSLGATAKNVCFCRCYEL